MYKYVLFIQQTLVKNEVKLISVTLHAKTTERFLMKWLRDIRNFTSQRDIHIDCRKINQFKQQTSVIKK